MYSGDPVFFVVDDDARTVKVFCAFIYDFLGLCFYFCLNKCLVFGSEEFYGADIKGVICLKAGNIKRF